jgi:magnesium transporter
MTGERPLNARTEALFRRLVRRDVAPALRKLMLNYRAEDVAAVMRHMTWSEQRRLYRAIEDRDLSAEILTMLPEDGVRQLTMELTEEVVVDLLERMELDDATDIVAVLPDDVRTRVLAGMEEDGSEVAQLLAWAPDTAGGLMSPEYFAMRDTATCGNAIRELQKATDDLAYVHYVYVIDREARLVGVISLRTLVVRPANTPLVSVMTRHPITVHPGHDQEEVARFVARYDLLSIPVVDDERRLLGIVTVDDVVDVIREEAAEDMYRMAGISEDADPTTGSVWQQTRQRGGWLLATIGGGICAAEIIGSYEDTLTKVAVLAGFIPVIMGMAGNVGIQSATVAVRGLATGHILLSGAVPFVWRELRVGVLLGCAYGAMLTIYGMVRYADSPMVGVSVGASIAVAIGGASILGAGIPVALSRFKIDPAVATGPIVTTIIDVVGIVVYFNIAHWMLGL